VVLDFLSATDVGRKVPDEEDAGSKASWWEFRERREWEGEREAEAEELGGGQRGACNVPPPRGQQTICSPP